MISEGSRKNSNTENKNPAPFTFPILLKRGRHQCSTATAAAGKLAASAQRWRRWIEVLGNAQISGARCRLREWELEEPQAPRDHDQECTCSGC
jgi:hypothetical protein